MVMAIILKPIAAIYAIAIFVALKASPKTITISF
jgi:hypothetical protein